MLKNLFGPASALALFGTVGAVTAQTPSAPDQPTFAKDVAPLLQALVQTQVDWEFG